MPKTKNLSTDELKNVSKFFYNNYIECEKMRLESNMYLSNNDICKFIYNEYLFYENEYNNKKMKDIKNN
jgi:hypothetical protein